LSRFLIHAAALDLPHLKIIILNTALFCTYALDLRLYEEDTMKRLLSILTMLAVTSLLSGCIISTSPKDNPVVLLPGQAKTFTIRVFPQPAKFAWYLEGNLVPGAEGNTFAYTIYDVLLPLNFTIEVRATGLLGTDKYTWNVHYAGTNKPPIAEAGPDQSTSVESNVNLDGSGSTDPENNIVSYHWSQTGGPPVTLSDPNAVKPHFIADVPVGSNLTFELTVTDAGNLTSRDACVVKIMENTPFSPQVSAGWYHTVGLKSDGTVVAVGLNNNNVSDWTGITQVSAGGYHTVGLKSDGTVVAVGGNGYDQCNVSGWTGITQVSGGGLHTVGLKSDGTVVAVGRNDLGECNVSGWTDITQVSGGGYHTVGLTSDGTVVAVGYNDSGQCNVSGWTGITQVSAGGSHTVGVKSDGTVVAVGYNGSGQCDVNGWTDITQVSAGGYHTVGLTSDGTVVAVGWNNDGQCDVSGWTGITQVAAGGWHTVGLKSDGTVVAVGWNNDGQCNVGGWNLIVSP
jgi:hypothetical protein